MLSINLVNFITVGLMAIIFIAIFKAIVRILNLPIAQFLWGEKMINRRLLNLHDFLVIGVFSILAILVFRFFVNAFYKDLSDII